MSDKKRSRSKTMYACGTDWLHEIGKAYDLEGNMPLYSTIEDLKANSECWETCGIVEVRLSLRKWISKQKAWKKIKES